MKLFGTSLKSFCDENLMAQVKDKDTAAFEELYNRYSKVILHYLYKMLGGSEAQAQDFLHDIFLKIIEKPYLFDQSKKFKTWIFQIAHNKCKNEYRKKDIRNQAKVKFELKEMYSQTSISPDTKMDFKSMNEIINQELSKYEEKHYSTFVLRYQHELSIKEIAEISDCPEGTVKSRLFYVTQKLVDKMKDFQQN
jgi:RNA polymerase sigma-70 factor, ECF subfamily